MTRSKQMLRAFSAVLWDTDLISSRLTLAFAEFCWAFMLIQAGAVVKGIVMSACIFQDDTGGTVNMNGSSTLRARVIKQ